ncbi:MAG: gliding motility-associated C-terminal domain-containing protein, partial [Opitutaceae bacterium]|nr:gliding motility-associated C-terminal domain-containing protein [Cytophagales bacterium]
STTVTRAVTVNSLPATPVPTAVPNPVCVGSPSVINSNVVASIYAWTLPDGSTSTSPTISIGSASALNSGIYSLIITNTSGCKSAAGTVNLSVTPLPVTTASNTGPYCVGGTLTTSASGPATNTYTWTLPSGATFVGQSFNKANIALSDSGIYKVTSTLNGCTSSVQTTIVKINPIPATPVVVSSTICSGQNVTLNCSNCSGTLTYAWSGPALASTNPSPVVNNVTNTSTYSLIITANNCPSLSGSGTVTVKPNIKPTITVKNVTICAGQTITLNATSSGVNPTFTWTGAGLIAPVVNATGVLTIPNAPTTATGKYFVTSTVNGCTGASDSASVVVNSVPSNPVFNPGKSSVCQSETGVAYSVLNTPGITYNWSYANGGTVFGTGNAVTVDFSATASSGNLSVIATNGTCPSSAATTKSITVNASPALPIASSNSPICVGNPININVTTVPNVVFNWVLPSGSAFTGLTYTVPTVSVSDAGNYLITATSNGCSSAVLTHNVVVNPGFIPLATANPACVGNTLTVSASGVVAPGATYSWKLPDGSTNNNQSFTIPNVQLKDSGNYIVTAHVGNCNSNPVTVKAIINPIPASPAVTGPLSVCQGASAQVYSITSPKGGETYTWSYSGTGVAFSSGNTGTSISANFAPNATAGSIQVIATSNACQSKPTVYPVTINALPSTVSSKTSLAVCEGNPINLNATAIAGATYSWSGPNGFSKTGQAQIITPSVASDAGNYIVTYTLNGCTGDKDTTSITVNPIPNATFAYAKASYCQSEPNATPVSVPAGSSFTSAPSGLSIASVSGVITLASSTPGAYKITNNVTSGAGCKNTAIFDITILKSPIARNFNYAGLLCDKFGNPVSPSFTSLGDPGSFSSTIGLTLDAVTGVVTPSTSNTGTFSVVYTSVAGTCSSTTSTSVDILPSPAKPTVSGSSIICQGTSSVLSASSGALINFDWFKGGSKVQTGGNTLKVTTAGSYTATSTALNGCPSTTSDPIVVFVAAKPVLPVIQGVCPLSALPDTLSTQYTSQAGYTFQWFKNKVSVGSGSNFIASTTGSYSTNVTETASGCVSDTSAPVNPSTGGVSISLISGKNPFCTGDSLQVASNSPTGNAWQLAGSSISNNASTFIKSAGQLILTVTNGTCSGRDTLDVNTIISPAKPAITSLTDSICPGSSVTLSTTTSGGLQWISNGADLIGLTTSSISVNTGGAYQVRANNGVCTAISNVKNIGVRPVPSKPILNLSGKQQICSGSSLALSVTNFVAGQDQWFFNNSPVGGAVGVSKNLSASVAGMYKLLRMPVGGCPVTSDSVDLSINSNITPSLVVTQDINNICRGIPVHYRTVTVNSGIAPTYEWFVNNISVQSGTSDSLKLDTLSKTSTVKVSVKSSLTCASPQSVSDSIITSISPGFKLTANIQNVGCTLSAPGFVNLVLTNSAGPFTFTGKLKQVNNSITVAGIYPVTITDSITKCSLDTSITVGKLSGFSLNSTISQPTCFDSNGTINIQPIPTSGKYAITGGKLNSFNVSSLGEGNFTISILDTVSKCTIDTAFVLASAGKFTNTIAVTQPDCGKNNGIIDIKSAPAGTYNYFGTTINKANTINLEPGVYPFQTTNTTTGCTKMDTVILNGNPLFSIDAIVNQPLCGAKGSIQLSTKPVIGFKVSGDLNTPNNSSLSAGIYNITITDTATKCFIDSAFVLKNQPGFQVVADTIGATCSNANGSIDLKILPATGYVVTGSLTQGFNDSLRAGKFNIRILSNATGCSLDTSFTLSDKGGFSVRDSIIQPDCGQTNGSAFIIPSPKGNYTFTGGGFNSNGSNPAITAGIYNVLVSNTVCQITDTVRIGGKPTFEIVATTVQPLCNKGGSINITTNPLIKYGVSGQLNSPINNGLKGGIYNITVTDSSTGCFKDTVITLVDKKDFALDATLINPKCFGLGKIDIDFIPAGTYSITSPDSLKIGLNSGLDTGSYPIRIVNLASNCEIDTTLKLTAIGRFTNAFDVTQPVCGVTSNGKININTTPVGTYTYEDATSAISGPTNSGLKPGTFFITTSNVTCAKTDTIVLIGKPNFEVILDVVNPGCKSTLGAINISTTPLITFKVKGDLKQKLNSGLDTSTYNFTVTDSATGCFQDTNVILKAIAPFKLSASVKSPDCRKSNGQLQLNVSPGPNSNYTFEVNGKVSSPTLDSLPGADYAVKVKNIISGCEVDSVYSLNSIPDFKITRVDKLLPACKITNGFIKLTLSEDTSNFKFDKSNGGNFASVELLNLGAGIYKARIFRKATTCLIDTSISLSNITDFTVTTDSLSNPECNNTNGKIVLKFSEVLTNLKFEPLSDFTSNSIRNKPAGTYRLRVSSKISGCIKDDIYTLSPSPDFTFKGSVITNPLCNVQNGQILLNMSNLNGVLQDSANYSILGSLTKFKTQKLASGSYSVTVNKVGTTCSKDTTIILKAPSAPKVNLGPDTLSVCNNVPVKIKAIVSDTGKFTFNWYVDSTLIKTTTIDSLPSVSPIFTTKYKVKLVNINGCESSDSLLIVKPTSIKLINTSYLPNDDNKLRLNFKVINLKNLGKDSVYIYRQALNSIVWTKIDSVPAKDTIYTRQMPSSGSANYYKVGLPEINTCGVALESRSQKNVQIITRILGDEDQDNESSDMNWNKFVHWDSVVVEYQVYRSVDDGPMTFYTSGNLDTLANYMNSSEGRKQCYRIKAIEKGPNGHESWSNTSCINYQNLFKAYNIFTPNGDGHNDFLFFKNLHFYPGNTLHVFNRWGNKVYNRENYANDWDGGGLPAGTYFYILDLKDGSKPRQGDILLHR